MRRLEDWEPTLKIDPRLKEFMDPDREDFELVRQIRAACSEPLNIDFTSSGVYGINDPRTADPKEYEERFEEKVQFFVDFIKIWKSIPTPPAFEEK